MRWKVGYKGRPGLCSDKRLYGIKNKEMKKIEIWTNPSVQRVNNNSSEEGGDQQVWQINQEKTKCHFK